MLVCIPTCSDVRLYHWAFWSNIFSLRCVICTFYYLNFSSQKMLLEVTMLECITSI